MLTTTAAQRAHWVSYRPNRVSIKSHFLPFSLWHGYAEGPRRLRTFPASWYTLTRSIHGKNILRQLWATFLKNSRSWCAWKVFLVTTSCSPADAVLTADAVSRDQQHFSGAPTSRNFQKSCPKLPDQVFSMNVPSKGIPTLAMPAVYCNLRLRSWDFQGSLGRPAIRHSRKSCFLKILGEQ